MDRFFFAATLLLVLILTSHLSFAQKDHKNNYWLGMSLGLEATQLPSGMVALGYEFTDRPNLLVARYTDNREILSDNQPSIKVREMGVLYGVRTGKFRFSTGLSGVWGIKRGTYLYTDSDPLFYGSYYYEKIRYVTVGIPGEVRFITSNKDAGIGVTAFGNLNAKRSFAGINLSFYVGQMKK